MMTTIKNPSSQAESLPTVSSIRTTSQLKSSFLSDSPDILSAAVLHKRRPQKRVRFALKLESVEESSLPSSRECSASLVSSTSSRVTDPWRQDGPLYGAYVEYLDKPDTLTHNEFSFHRTPPPPPPPGPEPGAELPTYTHTFVIKSKSPEMVINSITVSTPPFHLPRILHRTRKTNKHQSPTLDSYLKQQLALSTSPRMIHTKKLTHSSDRKHHQTSVHNSPNRSELNISSTNGLHTHNRILRSDNSFGSQFINDHLPQRKITEVIGKPLAGVNNQINHFSERPILPDYSKKVRMHSRTSGPNDEFNSHRSYFNQNHDNDQLLQPTIYSAH